VSERATDLILPYDEYRDTLAAHSFVLEEGWIVANPLYPDVYKTACIRALHGALEKSMATSGKRRLQNCPSGLLCNGGNPPLSFLQPSKKQV